MRRGRIAILSAVVLPAALWAYACGDGTEPEPDPPRPATVTVTPATSTLTALDATVQLTAKVHDQYGDVMANASVSWSSSDATLAEVDGSGLVTAAGNGAATITAMAGGASGSAAVTVAQVVGTVTVSPAAASVLEGDTLRLSAEAFDENGHAVPRAEFSWTSGDTAVAMVDNAGLVTGVDAGESEVTATAAGITGRAELTVVAPAPTTISVTPDTLALTALGQTAQLTAEVRDQAGRAMDGVPVAWSSADTTVAAVDSAGLVTAAESGVTTITATAGEATGDAQVTVIQSADSVVVSPPADTIAPGDTLRIVAEAFDANGHLVEGAHFAWSSTDVSVVRVDPTGLVRGVGREGTATITATAGAAQGTAEITVVNPDRAALVALYNATDGANWFNNGNWLTDAPLAEWVGVQVDGLGRVFSLRLIDNDLTGPIPPELGNLANLKLLSLYSNDLTGPIPPGLGNLTNLSKLSLWGNSLTGSIPPELGGLANLTSLHLGANDLTGLIPPELGNLANLTHLNLGGNEFTGPIPPELGDLANLTLLALWGNNLAGPIPPELGDLANLIHLDLSFNNLTGPIPPELDGLANLTWLGLYHNNLTGSIPPELGGLANLTDLKLSNNELTDPIPPELGGLGNLTLLTLEGNNLTGPIPPELGDLANLTWLRLEGNNLTGPIPPELGDLANLTFLRLSNNELTGPIPPELGGLANLTSLSLWGNNLTGPIPPELGDLANLIHLDLSYNNLTGPIPRSFLQLEDLYTFYISGNVSLCVPGISDFAAWLGRIRGDIGAASYCNVADINVLNALYHATGGTGWSESDSWLTDAAVSEWYGVTADSLGRVTELHLARNELAGELPGTVGDLTRMTVLWIGGNALAGRLPRSLARVPLREFRYPDTELCAPSEESFQAWLASIESHEGTGVDCEALSERDVLEALYHGNRGPNWTNNENWLTDAPLGDWIGVRVDGQGRVVSLSLRNNNLTGRIRPELGDLTNLTELWLSYNNLTGPIPPELDGLANLTTLVLSDNHLMGPIPPELGDLANLTQLGACAAENRSRYL